MKIYPWVLTKHANHTIHHELPHTQKKTKNTHGNAISFLFFFYDDGKENLSAINLYGQPMTLMFICMVILYLSCFSIMTFYEISVFALWHHMKLMYSSLIAFYEILVFGLWHHIKLMLTLNSTLFIKAACFP